MKGAIAVAIPLWLLLIVGGYFLWRKFRPVA